MVQIVVDAGQAKQILESEEPVEILGPGGRHLGFVRRRLFTPEEVRDAVQRADDGGPWYTTEEVLAHLRSLERK
jgi:hypothetical protein